jgi:hypothetical protein
MSATPTPTGTAPATPIIFPAGFVQAEKDALKAANPAAVFINIVTTPLNAAVPIPADVHRDTVNQWCDTIEMIEQYAGGAAASIIVSPAMAPFVVKALTLGTEAIRRLLLKDPVKERYTLADFDALPVAARPSL